MQTTKSRLPIRFSAFVTRFGLALTLSSAVLADPLAKGGWASYRGPAGDGSTKEKISASWSTSSAPKEVWRSEAKAGFSSISVADGQAYTIEARDVEGVATEVVVARDAATGKEKWASSLKPAKYDGGGDSGTKDNKGGDGPRSTPTVADGCVLALGGDLTLCCFDAASGKVKWTHAILEEFDGKLPRWQNAASPVVVDGLCIVAGGGDGKAFLAFDVKSGNLKWSSGNGKITHATPTVATLHGELQVIFFMQEGLVSVSPKDGKQLWNQAYPFKTSTAASPVVWQDIVYCSAGYGVGGGAFRISKEGGKYASAEIWRTEGKTNNHWSTPVVKDGYLYGMFSFKEYGAGPVACVDIRTGEQKWEKEGFGPGNVILAGDELLALSDAGELVVIPASPEGYAEKSRADVLQGKCWSTPTLAGGYIFARSTSEAGCWLAK